MVLLHVAGEHLPFARRLAAQRNALEDVRRKGKRGTHKVDAKREQFTIWTPGNKGTTVSRRRCRKSGMAAPHWSPILLITLRTWLAGPLAGWRCLIRVADLVPRRREKVAPEARPSATSSLKLDDIVNDEHKFNGRSHYLFKNHIIISICESSSVNITLLYAQIRSCLCRVQRTRSSRRHIIHWLIIVIISWLF